MPNSGEEPTGSSDAGAATATATATAPPDDARPWWFRSNYKPVAQEIDSHDLPTQGTIPAELNGLLLRNGPNPDLSPTNHWFSGQGMLHGIRFRDGQAQWYRNRRIDAPDAGNNGYTQTNIHVISHAGRILALGDNSRPVAVSGELEQLGALGDLAMAAHPKICPLTGEMHTFSTSLTPPYLTYHQFSPQSELTASFDIDLPAATMMHDFAITADHAVFLDMPIVHDPSVDSAAVLPYRWSADHQPRVGVLPRGAAPGDQPSWFEIEPGYVFHTINACDIGRRVVLDTCRYPELWRQNANTFESPAMVRRYDIHLDDGFVREETTFDIRCEYPRIDDRKLGLPNHFAYVATMAEENYSTVGFGHRVVQLDLARNSSVHHHFGPSRYAGEPVFVPRSADSAEDDGFVLVLVYNRETEASSLVILSAQDLAAEPLAVVAMTQRVPYGFHSSWLSEDDLAGLK